MNSYPVFLTAFLVTLASTPLLRLLAFKLQILDFPGARKIHKTATPLLGGVAIYLGLLSGLFIGWKSFSFLYPLIISATIILIIGFINDTIGLSAQFRLLCQVLVSLILISSGIRISFLPPTLWGNILEVIITIIWIVGVTNAYNYLDGLDGLAAGSAVVNAVCFAVILYGTGQYPLGELAIILALASLAFLPFNFSSKKMFLGDAGSTFLGFFLACLALVGSWAEDNIVKISIPFLILGVPIFDMIFTTIMRIKEEKVKTVIEWLRYGGKDHFHHYLVDIGLRPIGAVIFIYFITLSLGISAVMVSNDKALEAFLTLSQAAIIFGVIATLIVVGKRRRSGWSKT
jgi:UDP-GlcNAc:undecaprenyl-phosphate GlcNAc-1-phosphate transferase